MEASSFAFKRNLEPVGDEHDLGPWKVVECVDLVSETHYSSFRAKADRLDRIEPVVVSYRLAGAVAAAPHTCAPVVESSVPGGRVHILTEAFRFLDPAALDDDQATAIMTMVLQALDAFERAGFVAMDLGTTAIGVDENGTYRILPNAYLRPPHRSLVRARRAQRTHAESAAGVGRDLCAARNEATSSEWIARLQATVDAIDAGRLNTIYEVATELFDAPPIVADEAAVDGPRWQPPADLLGGDGVFELCGGDACGKTDALERVCRAFLDAGSSVCWIDTWDVPAQPRRKTPSREERSCVWLVDDVENVPYLHAELVNHAVLEAAEGVPGLIYTTNPGRGAESTTLLQSIRTRSDRGFESIDLSGGEGTARVADAFRRAAEAFGCEGDEPAALLDALPPQTRHILELVAVADLPVPLDVIPTVFPGHDRALYEQIHRLCAAGLLAVEYRTLGAAKTTSATVDFTGSSIRRALGDCIPAVRRRNLNRTVAGVARDRGGFPSMYVYRRLMEGGEPTAAARQAARFFRESDREQRAPFLQELLTELTEKKLCERLDYGDQLLVLRRLAGDLFALGRRDEAEQLLMDAREIDADSDDVSRNASLLSETLRLLADTWAARGDYSRALDLLYHAKDSLNTYMGLADQAQLLNEIGWLQYRLGEYDSSVESCKLSLNTLNPNEYPLVVAQALNLMGVIHFNRSRYDEAISYYEQAAFLREREHARDALAGSYNNLALAYQSKAEYDKALTYYNKSLEIKRRQNNEAGIAAGCLNMALLHLEVHNFDEADKMCRESLQIANKLGPPQLVAENHSTLGDIAFTRGRFDEAEDLYRKSLTLARSLETINGEMGAQRRLAKLYLTKARYEEAHEAISEAGRLGIQIGSKYENAQIEFILGDLELARDNAGEAIDHYEKAASYYATVSKYRLASASLAKVGLAHAESGNPLEAKHYLDRAQDLIKSEIGHEIPDEIVTLQQTLREQPVRSSPSATETQKLLYAFYELSSLSEYADDKTSFFRRIVAVFQDLTAAGNCSLALAGEEGSFVSVNREGDQEPLIDPGLRQLLNRSLQLGALLHSESPEIADVRAHIKTAEGAGLVCVPMKSMGRNLGCVLLQVPASRLPLPKEDVNFITSIGRHVAGDLRLTFYFEEHAHKEETLEKEFESLKAQVVDRYQLQNLIGKDESMKKVFRTLEKIKDMDTGILIIGESGTGKTELARTVHYNSPRRKRHFQQIHCAEIPTNLLESELFGHEKGAFTGAVARKLGRCEVADGGTIFLDDVNVMPMDTQAKLLNYLESKSFIRLGGTQKITTDVRIIAASNEDLEKLAKEGRFREDLFYRLKVILVDLPPLRERREDMIAIAQEFIRKRCQAQGKPLKTLASETMKLFQQYHWPGNVRELQNVLEQVVLLSDDDIVEPSSLPEDFLKKTTGSGRQRWQNLETLAGQMVETDGYSTGSPLMPQIEALLAKKMVEHVGSKGKAASMLGITKPTLYNRLRSFEKLN